MCGLSVKRKRKNYIQIREEAMGGFENVGDLAFNDLYFTQQSFGFCRRLILVYPGFIVFVMFASFLSYQ